jgi:hypothetical protein
VNCSHVPSNLFCVVLAAVSLYAGVAVLSPAAQAHPASTSTTTATAAAPSTSAGIWQAIDSKTAELAKTIQSGKLTDVHHVAFAIRDLVATLPDHSSELSADKLAKVKAGVKFVATLADRLDASGDANDKAGAQDNADKLAGVLKSLRANYTK